MATTTLPPNLHADADAGLISAVMAYAHGLPVEYLKPSTGTWVVLKHPKFSPDHEYRAAPGAISRHPADNTHGA